MPGLGAILSAFAAHGLPPPDAGHAGHDSGDPWGGLTAEKLLSTMHPKMQKLLKAMPDVRRDYVRELDTALVESRSSSNPDDIKMLREQIEGAIKEMNSEIGQNPAALDDLMKETASKMALCPFVIAPPNTLPEKAGCRLDHRKFL
ncbi:unnamed protein product [Symbiodinium natans]|uniref:Uncharacterized protein n=1 Tax=Symbiodinium natans TaxID=878477 RepID=A0A812UNJ2_9DINO|nr:unnamed protein product [Symbiodinium natans]